MLEDRQFVVAPLVSSLTVRAVPNLAADRSRRGVVGESSEVTSSKPRWSNATAQMTWRISVPMPWPWNLRANHDPVSPVRVTRKSLVSMA